MVVNKRKKLSRYRGSKTHGGGSKKKRRGAGHRGGRGMAGSGKRADQKKPTILKLYGSSYFGKKGFNRPRKSIIKIKAINILDINKLIDKGKVNEKEIIDLGKLGYNKLLSKGNLKYKVKIKVDNYSKKSLEKIKQQGGEIVSDKNTTASS